MPSPPPKTEGLDRREFLQAGVVLTAAVAGAAAPARPAAAAGPRRPRESRALRRRRTRAYHYRQKAARLAARRNRPLTVALANGEETDYPNRIANYSKGLPHDALGEVDPRAYELLLRAVETGAPADFEAIPLARGRKLTSPQAGLAFDLEGPDAHSLAMRAAPRIDGPENSSEMAELYWMALARDVHFEDYATDPTVAAAASDLSRFSYFRGPKAGGLVTPATLFRGVTSGDVTGPWLSQFLLLDVPYGSLTISQRQRTVLPGIDYLTDYASWLAMQDGQLSGPDAFDPTPRYIRNLRDLGQYVHVDALYEAYLNACLILLGLGAPLDAGMPPATSANQAGFAEYGGPHVLSLVTEVATRALKAVWCQKWLVHRRLRPEEFGGRVHHHLTHAAVYPIDREILASPALDAVHERYGTYLLPQAFPEGCPTHPAYGSGHATVAGACVTVLKAFFDESFVLPEAYVANADGTALVPWTGGGLTVRDELNKLAGNVATARNGAGIHWRTDYSEAVVLGETVALGILEEQKESYNQDCAFTLTKLDGTTVTI
jgi:hypothetical protein